VLRFTTKVKKREVRVRDVDLPDGATVDVTIAAQLEVDEDGLTKADWAAIRAAERAFKRGEYFTLEESLARLGSISLFGHDYSVRRPNGGPRDTNVGAATRRRTKSVARRVRKRP